MGRLCRPPLLQLESGVDHPRAHARWRVLACSISTSSGVADGFNVFDALGADHDLLAQAAQAAQASGVPGADSAITQSVGPGVLGPKGRCLPQAAAVGNGPMRL